MTLKNAEWKNQIFHLSFEHFSFVI